MERFGRYTLQRLVGEGADSGVYDALDGNSRVALKRGRGSPEHLAMLRVRYRREAALLAQLKHPVLVPVHEVGDVAGIPYVATEFVTGDTLRTHLIRGAFPVIEAARVGALVASGLDAAHRAQIVNADIKPENILLSATGDVRLIDFGLAIVLGREALVIKGDAIAGTLLYAAPEQTGARRAPVDGRADLYALGVVLFELVTGALPFTAQDPVELVRAHAEAPIPDLLALLPDAPISRRFAAIVTRLLAKAPTERFANAAEVARSLAELANVDLAFAPAGRRLVGAEPLLSEFRARTERTKTGGQRLVLAGASGSGKTAALQILSEVAPRSLWVDGRAHSRPWVALDEAVRRLLQESSQHDRQRASLQTNDAAAATAGIVLSALPSASLLLPASPAVAVEEAQLIDAVAGWLAHTLEELAGGVVLVDDWESLDRLSQMTLLAASTHDRATLLVGTAPAAPFAGAAVYELPSLDVNGVSEAFRLRFDRLPQQTAAVTLQSLCGGRPAMLWEATARLIEAGALYPAREALVLDDSLLTTVQLPASVEAAASARVDLLTASHREALRALACLGQSFSLQDVAEVGQRTTLPFESCVVESIQAGVLIGNDVGGYRFSYPPLRERLLLELSADRRASVFLAFAESLLARSVDDVALLADAFNQAGALSGDARTRAAVANAHAAQQAVVRASYVEALRYIDQLAQHDPVQARRAETLLLRGRALAGVGDAPQAAKAMQQAIDCASSDIERATIHIERLRLLVANFDYVPAMRDLLAGAAELGVSLSTSPLGLLSAVASALWTWLLVTVGLFEGRAPASRRERLRLFIRLAELGSPLCSQLGERKLMLVMALRAMLPAHLLGDTAESGFAYMNCAMLFAVVRGQKGAATSRRLAGRAERILRANASPVDIARVQLTAGWAGDFRGEPLETERQHTELLTYRSPLLYAADYWRACTSLAWNQMMRGHLDAAMAWIDRVSRVRDGDESALGVRQGNPYLAYRAALFALKNQPELAAADIAAARALAEQFPAENYRWGHYLAHAMLVAAETHASVDRLRELLAMHQRRFEPHNAGFHMRHFYVYASHAFAERCIAGDVELAEFEKVLVLLRRAAHVPSTQAHLALLEAVHQWLGGHVVEAETHLVEALRLAEPVENAWVRFEVDWLRARMAAKVGDTRRAQTYAVAAHAVAAQRGFLRRALAIRAQFQLLEGTGHHSSPSAMSNSATVALGTRRQIEAIGRVSAAAARSIHADEVGAIALDELVSKLGAERGFLFLSDTRGQLQCRVARAQGGVALATAEQYSASVVERVRATRESVIMSGDEQGEVSTSRSISVHQLRSILAAPMTLADEVKGIIYLDSRVSAGMFAKHDLDVLMPIASQLAGMLEAARFAETEVARSALEKDLALSAEVQRLILPHQREVETANLHLAGSSVPASQCGGDYWWYGIDAQGACLVLLCDVTGHGAGPAMITAALAGMQAALLNTTFSVESVQHHLLLLHGRLRELAGGAYLVACSALFVPRDGAAHLFSAGGLQMLLQHGETISVVGAPGRNLGGDEFDAAHVTFERQAGDRLLIFTDGVTELERSNGRPLGLRGLRQLLLQQSALSVDAARDAISAALVRDRKGTSFEDDVSFVLVDIR